MTTLAHRTNFNNTSLKPGMSLLEVVVALILVSLLMTIGLVAYNGQSDDKNLRTAVIEIESLASRARTISFLKQQPYRLAITGSNSIKLEKPVSAGGYGSMDTYTATNIRLSLRRWGAKDDEWLTYDPDGREEQPIHWYFSPTGLCEPISLRLEEGTNWVVLHMDPLTGRIQEEESYIK